jgi:hypothetical protein
MHVLKPGTITPKHLIFNCFSEDSGKNGVKLYGCAEMLVKGRPWDRNRPSEMATVKYQLNRGFDADEGGKYFVDFSGLGGRERLRPPLLSLSRHSSSLESTSIFVSFLRPNSSPKNPFSSMF